MRMQRLCAGPCLPLFQACTLVMRRDSPTARFLLPYIVQVCLRHSLRLPAQRASPAG